VVIAGATGYIGKAVVAESVKRGYNTIALVRSLDKVFSEEGQRLYGETFKGAKVVQVDVSDADQLTKCMSAIDIPVDTIVSCLASPVGTKKEAYAIDYQATLNCLNAGRDPAVKARHFILLSAFCCRRPLLQLQQAKLKFEGELAAQNDLTWSVIRPTAFFKSVSGQLEGIQNGNPYVLFGDGAVTRCNPIAESELAEYMLNCMTDESKCNKIMNIGGPDKPLTNKMLGDVSGCTIFITIIFILDKINSHNI
jgi:Predicted nucleoside-diphosphate-sugar epimerases